VRKADTVGPSKRKEKKHLCPNIWPNSADNDILIPRFHDVYVLHMEVNGLLFLAEDKGELRFWRVR